MSAALDAPPPPSGFVPRGEESKRINSDIQASRRIERQRHLRHLVTIGGGWVMAGVMGLVAMGAMAMVLHRPVPKDRLAVAFARDDGSFEPPTLREDLPRSRRDVLFRYSVIQHVYARENYTWEGVRQGYRRVSATTTPEERDRYQAMMHDPKSRENPEVRYGSGPNAATATVTAINVVQNRATPNAVTAHFRLRVRQHSQPPREESWTAYLTWVDAADKIPLENQQQYAPGGIAFSHYETVQDPQGVK